VKRTVDLTSYQEPGVRPRTAGKLTERQAKLLRHLRRVETSGRRTTREEMASATGYSIDSIRPYVAKGMLKKWLVPLSGSSFLVRGIRTLPLRTSGSR